MGNRVVWLESGQTFEVQPDEVVLQAALRGGIALPHECKFGGCGTCRVKLIDGEVEYDEFPLALTPEEASAGYALACQAKPRSDLVISVDQPNACSKPTRVSATVAGVAPLADDVLHLQLHLPDDS